MKRLLIVFFCFSNQALYGMEVKQRHADEKMAAEQVQSVPREIGIKATFVCIHEGSAVMSRNDQVAIVETSVVVHDLEGNILLNKFIGDHVAEKITARAISDDATQIAFADNQGYMGIIDREHENAVIMCKKKVPAYQMTFNSTGERLAVLGMQYNAHERVYYPYLAVFDKGLVEIARTYICDERGNRKTYKAVDLVDIQGAQIAISADGAYVAAATTAGLTLWHVTTDTVVLKINDIEDERKFTSVIFNDDNTLTALMVKIADVNDHAVFTLHAEQYSLEGKSLNKRSFGELKAQDGKKLDSSLFTARLKDTQFGRRILFMRHAPYVMIDFATGKILHTFPADTRNSLYCVGYNTIVAHRGLSLDKTHPCTVFETAEKAAIREKNLKQQAEIKAKLEKAAALRKRKRVIAAAVCMGGVIAAYVAWQKFKKKKKPMQIINALSQKRVSVGY